MRVWILFKMCKYKKVGRKKIIPNLSTQGQSLLKGSMTITKGTSFGTGQCWTEPHHLTIPSFSVFMATREMIEFTSW